MGSQVLIYRQMPPATQAMGYKGWHEAFVRHAKKGEKGIALLAKAQEREAGGKPSENGKAALYFFPAYAFGAPQLPELSTELKGGIGDCGRFMGALKAVSPFPISFEEIGGEAKGYCDFENEKIVINIGMGEAQSANTALHEIAHASLHSPKTPFERMDINTMEVEAESVAYIVCAHYGVDTSAYSLRYIASWSSSKELPELMASMERILDRADALISQLGAQLEGAAAPEAQQKQALDAALAEAGALGEAEKGAEGEGGQAGS